jgi:hypothetical protein
VPFNIICSLLLINVDHIVYQYLDAVKLRRGGERVRAERRRNPFDKARCISYMGGIHPVRDWRAVAQRAIE